MSIKCLYEFSYSGSEGVYRVVLADADFVVNSTVTLLGEDWHVITSIEEYERYASDNMNFYMTVTDGTGNFSTWATEHASGALMITKHFYDTVSQSEVDSFTNAYTTIRISSLTGNFRNYDVVYLYEFNYLNGSSVRRVTRDSDVQALTYTWNGISLIEELDLYMNIKDLRSGSNNLITWMSQNEIDKVFVYRYRYDTRNQRYELIKQLYSNVNSDSSSATLRKCEIPEEQLEDAQRLIADGLVQLYEVKLADGTTYNWKQDDSVTWNGATWTGIPILFEGYSTAQGDSYSRPTLTIANPDVLSANDEYAHSTMAALIQPQDGYEYGLLYRAKITRYLVLYDDLKNNRPIYQKKSWIVWHIKLINRNMIQVELRNPMDGVNFDIPARMYIPPEFPFVTLK